MSSTFEDTNDIVLLEHCFDEFGMVQEFNLCGNIIKVQPADDVPHACDRIWQGLEPITKLERSKIGPSASLDDIFPNLAAAYRPQLFHYYVHDDGRAAVAWRVPFVAGELNNLKSLMVALMMWNGIADSRHVWQMLGHGVGLDELDVFLWGYVTDDEKNSLERGQYPKILEVIGGPAPGFANVHEEGYGIRIPFER